ncbi:DprA-like DNA recombination-mediator protein [Erwinia phage phiEaH2]|uniref:Uncharacterized protein n=1 Tax=Erwinia phage phiEaH2 TaxID=1029988 RepID=J7KC53_9CAUD|nr:DprA-like DNA recombination-mediator protein [Erwinia phage phiEaH2]AFQ96561.1 hypothetical protein [Erwinia phage phiEaH2]
MKEYKIAVVGSRETPPEVMHEMYMVLLRGFNMLIRRNYKILFRSGGCYKGPDQLEFQFARQWDNTIDQDTGRKAERPDQFICYLPDDKKLWLKNVHKNVEFRVIEQTEAYREIVSRHHPAPDKLQPFAWGLHGRNLNIVMGDNLDDPVDAVYYSAEHDKHGNPKGGTAMAVKYAKECGVPCFFHATDARAWLESLRLL